MDRAPGARAPLTDDVLLDLVGAPVDHRRRREQDLLLDQAAAGALGSRQERIGAEDHGPGVAMGPRISAHHELGQVRGPGRGPARPGPKGRVAGDVAEGRGGRGSGGRRVVVALLSRASRMIDDVRSSLAPWPMPSLPRREVAARLGELVRDRAGEGAARRTAASAAQAGPLGGEGGVGDGPTVVEPPTTLGRARARRRCNTSLYSARPSSPGAVAPLRPVGSCRRRVRDAGCLVVGVGAGEQHPEVAQLRGRRLTPSGRDHPLVAVALGPALQAGDGRNRRRLAEKAGTRRPRRDDPPGSGPSVGGAVRDERGSRQEEAECPPADRSRPRPRSRAPTTLASAVVAPTEGVLGERGRP